MSYNFKETSKTLMFDVPAKWKNFFYEECVTYLKINDGERTEEDLKYIKESWGMHDLKFEKGDFENPIEWKFVGDPERTVTISREKHTQYPAV